jgi:hypothetical protein
MQAFLARFKKSLSGEYRSRTDDFLLAEQVL